MVFEKAVYTLPLVKNIDKHPAGCWVLDAVEKRYTRVVLDAQILEPGGVLTSALSFTSSNGVQDCMFVNITGELAYFLLLS